MIILFLETAFYFYLYGMCVFTYDDVEVRCHDSFHCFFAK